MNINPDGSYSSGPFNPNSGSGKTGVLPSLPPTYPVRVTPDPSIKLE